MACEVARRVSMRPHPDLFYARQVYCLAAVARLRVPMVFEAHTPPVNILQKHVEGWIYRQAHFTRLVVVSDALRREYQRLFPWLPDMRVTVAHDAAQPFTPAPPPTSLAALWPGRPNCLQVGYVGHLYQGRGIGLITSLAKMLPDMDFHLVGGMERDINRWESACAEPNLHFHGFVAPQQLASYYARFDLVLAPYQQRVLGVGGKKETSRWMSPLKVFESMAAGKALVCSDHPVLHEVLTHGVNAWLVPASDPDAWRLALETLRDSTELREFLGRNAHADFLAHYTWEKRAEKVLAPWDTTTALPHWLPAT
jgi:glycosyltransferase involved in cell wall biosynthesis